VLAVEPDPAVVTDAAARERIKATGKPWKIEHKPSGIVMLLVPPGEFVMGSLNDEVGHRDDEALHKHVILKAFYLSQNEVSKAEWKAIAKVEPGSFPGDTRPVEGVSWIDIHRKFVALGKSVFRLPSEAEWEYACRAGTTTAYSVGDALTKDHAHFEAKSPIACGGLPASAWGFHDMHGNVREWVEDGYADYPKEGGTGAPARSEHAEARVLRGGGWSDLASDCRAATRLDLPRVPRTAPRVSVSR
jgi:formylglycine-generating enzyme required for sulfatase activity